MNDAKNNVVRLPASNRKEKRAFRAKWGAVVERQGYCMFPSLLLRAQARLHIDPTQLAVLLHLLDHWWDPKRKPYPAKKRIAERLGVSDKTVQRAMKALEDEGLIHRERRFSPYHGGRQSNIYHLDGLVKRLKELAPEFEKAKEEAHSVNHSVTRPGVKIRLPKTDA